MLDKAFDALKTYDWGQDRSALNPIDEAIVASHGKPAERRQLEDRLSQALANEELSYDARQFLCRKLRLVGTDASVETLAGLLADEKLSHMARYALQGIPAPEAAAALRSALPRLDGQLKIGVISTLGDLGDLQSVPLLAELLANSEPSIATAAAKALGAIRTAEAAQALAEAKPNSEAQAAVADARLACAEAMLANGKKKEALVIYRTLTSSEQPKHVSLAAKRGMLATVGK